MATIKDFIKKIGNETVSLEEQQRALAAVEQTIVEAKAKREESIGKNVDLVISALKKIESDLEAKLIELNNTPAKQGVAGPQGEKGRDGRDGKDGYKGQDGKDGVDGQDGKDGSDGISVTDAKVDFDGSLVITLSDGREIDAGTVVSLDVAKNIHSVQTGGTGSTSQAVLDAIAAIQATIATYGTMATQNANAVAITGGTINGTTVGSTTPAAGTFTTITGQTEVLKGTGENLVTYSNTFTNAYWAKNNSLSVTGGQTDPFGGSTASLLAYTTQYQSIAPFFFLTNGLTYTFSIWCYVASGTRAFTLADVSGGVYTSFTATTSWARYSVTFTATTSGQLIIMQDRNASGFVNAYIYGAQVEIGSVMNSYNATTSAAIYGTPTLSFSGVAGLGLQSDGSLYVSPAGTGALQAQATTSSTVGGNARGANAVDWQTLRSTASMVASSTGSVLVGGQNNTSSAYTSFVGAGANNYAQSGNSFVGGGNANVINGGGSYGAIVAGGSNAISSPYSFIGGGLSNTGAGYYNFIGGGFTNSGTALAAVTTQSGTMNATTAVTLSGSNASIKVGQYITGTSIASDTYVAAISGTALTLSKNASGSSTSTLSFYTPHGVVVGGGNNQATGSYSFIGGGGDAGTAANRNVASGDWSVVAGGIKNTASGNGSFVGGGGLDGSSATQPNQATGVCSVIVGGNNNISSAFCSTIVNGAGNQASGLYSFIGSGNSNLANARATGIVAGYNGTARSVVGNHVFPACVNPIAASAGVSQSSLLILARQTTDATATVLASDANAASGTNQVILPNNSAYYFRGEVVSGVTGGGNTKGWYVEGVIKRGANAGTTALVGTPTVTSLYADAGAATWALTATADTTNGGLAITFTGQAATTIRTVCQIRTTEMTY
jgi:hypothetical protein